MNQFIFRRRYDSSWNLSGIRKNYAMFYYSNSNLIEITDIVTRINEMLYDNCIGSDWERINKFR